MKILSCLTYYWPHRTGLTLYAQRVAEALAQRGHEVTILTSRFKPGLPRKQWLNGVQVLRLRPYLSISRGVVMPGFPWAAYRLITENDVVNIHTPILEASLVAFLARRVGKRLVITHHGDLMLPGGLLNRLIEKLMLLNYRYAAFTAHTVVGNSTDYAEHSAYLAPYRHKMRHVYPAMTANSPSESGRRALRELVNPEGGAIVGYAGRFVEEKRADILLRAIPYIRKSLPDAKVAFAGEYHMFYEKFYERCVPFIERNKPYLHFFGVIEDDQVLADFYSACDVLVIPSDSDCFPLVQVEAMLCGTPVVVTNIPGLREPVTRTGMGEIVPRRNPRALAEAIVRVVKDRERYVKPHEIISETFSFERTVDSYVEILSEAAAALPESIGGQADPPV
jgi:glycosyltransferase involved in cell wall biosynthesis